VGVGHAILQRARSPELEATPHHPSEPSPRAALTPSGTNGFIQRNASSLQIRQGPPGGSAAGYKNYEDYLNEIAKPPVHRAPDAGILEHERKRQIEIKCLELRDKLEDDE
jgi:hypothetical protein